MRNVTMNVNMSSWSGNNGNGSGVETTGGPGVSRLRLVFRHARQVGRYIIHSETIHVFSFESRLRRLLSSDLSSTDPTIRFQSPPTARADPSRGGAGAWGVYPHLQCPPTFQPESYSLARLAPAPPHPPPHAPPKQREPRDS